MIRRLRAALQPERRRVTIVVPWIPQYRVAFYSQLRSALALRGIELRVLHGGTPYFAKGRGDARSLPWAESVRALRLRLGRRELVLRWPSIVAVGSTLLVLEDSIRHVDTWIYALARRGLGLPVAFWGTGRKAIEPEQRWERWIKDRLLGLGTWWFAYTEGSSEPFRAASGDEVRVTIVNNTVDAAPLRRALEALNQRDVDEAREEMGLKAGHSAVYIGSLDPSKNVPLLIDAAALIAAEDESFRLVVVGDGPSRAEIAEASQAMPWILLLGSVFDDHERARIGAACDFLVHPGPVGLVVVDAMALRLPMLVTRRDDHGPEIDYVAPGENGVMVGGTLNELVRGMRDFIERPRDLEEISRKAGDALDNFTIEEMVARFVAGIELASARKRP